MRTLLSRYVLLELLKVFGCALVALTLFVVLVGVAQEAISQGLGPMTVLQLVPFILPEALRFSVPATILFAICSVYGRMAASNEFVAAKSLGISPLSMVWPGLGLAFLLSLLAVWLNDVAVSWGRAGVQQVVVQSAEKIAYGMLRTHRVYSDERFSINVKRVDDRTLVRPTITLHGQKDKPTVVLTANHAELRRNSTDNTLSLVMFDTTVDVEGEVTAFLPGRQERVVPLSDTDADSLHEKPSYCPLWKIPDELSEQRREIRSLEESLAIETAFELLSGNFSSLGGESWQDKQSSLASANLRMHRLTTEPWRRWANGFSCFFFCLVGAPLAISLRKADFVTSFFLCFLPILIVYYPLMALGVEQAKNGTLPAYSVWLGNAICLVVGVWLLRRIVKH